jgi:DNA polymerase-3 subunit alpha
MSKYIPLHVHSEYSLLNSNSQCDSIAKRINDLELDACALTDHGSVSGAIDFSKSMRDKKIKPILGCEFYTKHEDQVAHQVVLAKNLQGWKNLMRAVTESNKRENIVERETDRIVTAPLDFFSTLSNDLLTFSGHIGSTLAKEVLDENEEIYFNAVDRAERKALELQELFGKENFFIEVQLIDQENNKVTKKVAEVMREVAKRTGIPTVATPDAHYCRKEDAEDQRVLVCTALKKTIPQARRELKSGIADRSVETFFQSDNYHIPSYEEMAAIHTEEELKNTLLINDMIEDYSILSPPNPPEFDCPNDMSPNDYLRYLCREGWAKQMSDIDRNHPDFKRYGNRVNHELEVFTSVNLSSYFLIVNDILEFVRSKGYLTGPGRGSSAGCLVADLLGITQVDPMPYDLLFERFYNAGRNSPGKVSWPDIDFDIPKAAREEAIEYTRNKYGKDKVAQILTFQTLKGKAALTRVMSVYGEVSFEEQKSITKLLLDENKISDELKDIEEAYGFSSSIIWALENMPDKLKRWCTMDKQGNLDGPLANYFSQAIRLEHTKIISGKHAAGVVVSKDPITEQCPMVLDKDGNNWLAGFEGPSCEEAGLLKLDCLAIRGLDKVMDVVSIVGGE